MLQYNPLGPYTSPSAYDVPLAPASTTTALRILQDATSVQPSQLSNGAALRTHLAPPQPPLASLPPFHAVTLRPPVSCSASDAPRIVRARARARKPLLRAHYPPCAGLALIGDDDGDAAPGLTYSDRTFLTTPMSACRRRMAAHSP